MITAAEAKDLYIKSRANIDVVLNAISDKITELAPQGNRGVVYALPEGSPREAIIKKLESHPYYYTVKDYGNDRSIEILWA